MKFLHLELDLMRIALLHPTWSAVFHGTMLITPMPEVGAGIVMLIFRNLGTVIYKAVNNKV